MSLGKKLMGMFIETAEAEENIEATSSDKAAAQTKDVKKSDLSAKPAPAVPGPATPPVAAGEADPALVDALRKTIQEHNLPGFDYLEFEAALKALETVIPDEGVRYRSAFATAAVQGLTLDALQKTSQSYRDLLVQERAQFEADLKSKQESDVAKRRGEIEGLAKEIQSKAEEVKRLTDEIAAAQEKQRKLETQAQKSAVALERARARFLESLSIVDGEIERNQIRIKTYLGGA